MLVRGKREWLARTIARSCHWLSKRSVRFRLLFEDIGGRLCLNKRLPAANPRYDAADLVRRTDEFNAAAEDYFTRSEDRDFLLGKPFTERRRFARRLFDLGVLFHWLRLTPGEVVLEIGAGSCWLSHLYLTASDARPSRWTCRPPRSKGRATTCWCLTWWPKMSPGSPMSTRRPRRYDCRSCRPSPDAAPQLGRRPRLEGDVVGLGAGRVFGAGDTVSGTGTG